MEEWLQKSSAFFIQRQDKRPEDSLAGTGTDKPKLTPYFPDIQITRLTKLPSETRMWKSPSLPSSPTVVRPETYGKPSIPAYVTLGRKGQSKSACNNGFRGPLRSYSDTATEDNEIEKIRSILASLDLAKYKRKPKSNIEIRADVHPSADGNQKNGSQQVIHSSSNNLTKKSFLDGIPPPPSFKELIIERREEGFIEDDTENNNRCSRHFSFDNVYSSTQTTSRPVNFKLKQLTEKLTSTSAPPSPHRQMKLTPPYTAPPTTSISFWKEPLPKTTTTLSEFDVDRNRTVGIDANENSHLQSEAKSARSGLSRLAELSRLLAAPPKRDETKNSVYSTLPRSCPPSSIRNRGKEPRLLSDLNIESKVTAPQRWELSRQDSTYNSQKSVSDSTIGKDLVEPRPRIVKPSQWSLPAIPQFHVNKRTSSAEGYQGKSDGTSSGAAEERDSSRTAYSDYRSSGTLDIGKGRLQSNVSSFRTDTVHPPSANRHEDPAPSVYGQYYLREKQEEQRKGLREQAQQDLRDQMPGSWWDKELSDKELHTNPEKERVDSDLGFSSSSRERQTSLQPDSRTSDGISAEQDEISRKRLQDIELHFGKRNETPVKLTTQVSAPNTITRTPCSTGPGSLESTFDPHPASRPRAMTVAGGEPKIDSQYTEPKRYFKKRLRGPYGEMLEQEMSKPSGKTRPTYISPTEFLKELDSIKPTTSPGRPRPFLRAPSHSFDETQAHHQQGNEEGMGLPKRKTSANIPIINRNNETRLSTIETTKASRSSEQRENIIDVPKSYAEQESDGFSTEDDEVAGISIGGHVQDTRTHVVGELYETEKSYVESLQIVVKKYMKPLKTGEHSGVIESSQVDEIFYQVPEILTHHEAFLEVLRQRISNWDTKQKIGDVFVDVFTRQSVIDTYTAFINNWKSAKEAIKSASQAKPAFARFLEHASREHKGKLTLDALLIMPVQRIPRYELLIKELLKHTPLDHPDHRLLLQAQKEVHDLAVSINQVEREALEQEQMMQKLRDIEQLIEGIVDLAQTDRTFIRHDFVTIPGGLGIKKDRCLFLFSDILLITNIKKRGAAMRKTSLAVNSSPFGSLESNKYKLLMRLPLQNVEVTRKADEKSVKRFLKEIGSLEGDVATLGKMSDMLNTLSCHHQVLDDALKEVLSVVSRQLVDKQASNAQLMAVELAVSVNNEVENLTIVFSNPEKRMTWENSFSEAKESLTHASRKLQPPTFMYSFPIRKTRSGLQVNCAVALYDSSLATVPDIWVCSSDEYVGQVCVVTVNREPTLLSCSTICSARILCIVYVPGMTSCQPNMRRRSTVLTHFTGFRLEKYDEEPGKQSKSNSFQLDSDTSDEEEFIDTIDEDFDGAIPSTSRMENDSSQATVWIGAEDGCIYVYSCEDIKIRRAKFKLQHSAAIYDIVYTDNKVIASLANGDVCLYYRDEVSGSWNTTSPKTVQLSGPGEPVTKILPCGTKLFCGNGCCISVLDNTTLNVEHTFQVTPDTSRQIVAMASSSQGIWVAIQNSPIVRLFHSSSFQELLDVNVAPAVAKMLSACDDIIRQHKSACLRISALLVCKNQLWVGTSAGVVLSLPTPHVSALTASVDIIPNVTGIAQGHTGHVRFITSIETSSAIHREGIPKTSDQSVRSKDTALVRIKDSVLVISGGEGYEDFSCLAQRESAGRDDSTNHLLIWRV